MVSSPPAAHIQRALIAMILASHAFSLQAPVSTTDPLRNEVATTIASMTSPCRYELDYSNYTVAKESSVGRTLLRLHLGELVAGPTTFEALKRVLQDAASSADSSRQGIRLATSVQQFHVEQGRERTVQWCTSEPKFPATLRTRDIEVAYFSEFRRLDFQKHTTGMFLFDPAFLIAPLPASAAQVDYFRTAKWTADVPTGETQRIHGFRAENAPEWLAIDLVAGKARLPFGCVQFPSGRGSRDATGAVYRWTTEGGVTCWNGVLYVTDAGEELELSLFERHDISHEVRDADVTLRIDEHAAIRDLTGGTPKRIGKVDELSESWRALVSLRGQGPETKHERPR